MGKGGDKSSSAQERPYGEGLAAFVHGAVAGPNAAGHRGDCRPKAIGVNESRLDKVILGSLSRVAFNVLDLKVKADYAQRNLRRVSERDPILWGMPD